MKKLTALLILSLSCIAASGQDSTEFWTRPGSVTKAELTQKSYPYDEDAEAAVIFEIGEYHFRPDNEGIRLNMIVNTKIKIYNDAGLEYAKVEIPYYTPFYEPESLSVEGLTYNMENGTITTSPLTKANIFTESNSDGWSVMKIAFPNVRAGSVIELKYTLVTPYFFQMRPWRFQKKIPVFYSMLDYYAIPFYEYAFIAKGLYNFDEATQTQIPTVHQFGRYTFREMRYTFGMNRVPAFRDEEFLYNTDDYMMNLHFQLSRWLSNKTGLMTDLMTTWPDMCYRRLKDPELGGYLSDAEKAGKKIVPQLGLNSKSPIEILESVVRYVKSNYVWDKGIGTYPNKKTAAFLKEKGGNSAAMNLFLTGLLKAAGLDARPVLVSTRENGIIYKDYPFAQSFDNTIAMVKIDGKNRFADASLPLTSYDGVPWWNANVEGLAIDKKEPFWVDITQGRISEELYQMEVDILPKEGEMRIELTKDANGEAAHQLRSTYNGNIENLRDLYKDNSGMNVGDISVENFDETSSPFRLTMKYSIKTGEEGAMPEKIYFNPLIYVAPEKNPFKQTVRTHPVDLVFSSKTNYFVNVNIPQGYSVDYLPQTVGYINDVMTLVYNIVASDDGKLVISAGYTLKNFYYPEDYTQLRELYDELVRTFSDMIILKRD